MTIEQVIGVLDTAYPPRFAESWDTNGLICGDPSATVTQVHFALECTNAVAEAALADGAQLLVVHHPLLLRGVTSVAAATPKGSVIHTLIRGGCALFNAHTNADCARPGVSDRLAELIGFNPGRPIRPILNAQPKDKWGVYIPVEAVERVKDALFAAGAGEIGNYSHCSFEISGQGQFRPEPGADPAEGTVGTVHRGDEVRVEFVAGAGRRRQLIEALRSTHPYEEPAFDITAMEDDADLDQAPGLGRVGRLPRPMTLRELTQHVADVLPETVWGVRAAGDPERLVETIAVSSGAGDSLLDDVRALGVDVYVTSDLRHHPVDESMRAGGPAIIDTAHWASEFPWTQQAAELIATETGLPTSIINLRTDPWTVSAHQGR